MDDHRHHSRGCVIAAKSARFDDRGPLALPWFRGYAGGVGFIGRLQGGTLNRISAKADIMRTALRVLAAALTICAAAGLMSCGQPNTADDGASHAPATPSNVNYTSDAKLNPYYADSLNVKMKRMAANPDIMKAILSDNVISADELNELQRRVVGCYADFGLVYVDLGEGQSQIGTASGRPMGPDSTSKADAQCQDLNYQFNVLATTYYQSIRNPDHADLTPYIVQCLQEHGIVGQTYTADDYRRDQKTQTGPVFGKDAFDAQTHACQSDPLNNGSGKLPREAQPSAR